MTAKTSYLKDLTGQFMFDHWLTNHQKLGGFLASSYVDWNILHSPLYDIVKKLEEYRQLPFESVMSFADADLIDNNMEYRDVLEVVDLWHCGYVVLKN